MPTIRDVSKLANVSVATVSRVINQSGYVNKETEEKVRQAMAVLQYVPSGMARSLAGKNSATIALIVPDILNPFFPELARAVEAEAQERGYTVILCNSDYNAEKEQNYFRVLASRRIDGIIIASNTIRPDQLLALQKQEIPVVVIDNQYPDLPILSLVSKNREGAKLAVRHLLEQDCRKIAHLSGPIDVTAARERSLGYEEEMQERGLFVPSLIAGGQFQIEGGYDAMLLLLERHPDLDGVFAGNDLMAVGALKALYKADRKVPQQVKLIGFDGIALSTVVPELTTVAQSITDMGRQATGYLMKMIQKEPVTRRTYELDVHLLIRQTTLTE
ncbi:LacI family DNA-binding transcriptional regulator [Paenibacillus sp. GCM10027626]|uniref:LacI family DNA-binding transcriptional regulator n=1 Tax=Paenibacillus sp. GCM10027626 TaxID=3273411 RepID=UPI00363CE666